jgi:hypothetical protein
MITEKLVEGNSIGSSIKATVSEKSAARAKGFKEKIDPMNIIKFMTGGSKFAAALYGSARGRSKEDMKYFTGTPRSAKEMGASSTRIDSLETGNEMVSLLMKIYEFMRDTNEEDKTRKQREANFKEEIEYERGLRHKALLEALSGLRPGKTVTATKEKDDGGFGGIFAGLISFVKGLISTAIDGVMKVIGAIKDTLASILGVFGGGLTNFVKVLTSFGRFLFFNPIGVAILAGTGLGIAIWKILKDPDSFEKEDSEVSRGIETAEKVGGLPGVKDESDRRKKMTEYDKTMSDILDYETYYNEGDKLNDEQLKGYAARGPDSLAAVEDYKFGKTMSTPTSQAEAQDLENGASQQPMPVPAVPASNVLNEKTKEMNDANLPTPAPAMTSQTTNTTNVVGDKKMAPIGPLPSVRNQEPTFANMILYSTRVV